MLRLIPLVLKNFRRNRRRALLTLLGVAVAIFVFAALGAAIEGMTAPVREVGEERLLNVREAARTTVISSRLPAGYEDRVAAVEGVRAATGVLSDLAVVGPERVHIFVRGVDVERYRSVRPIVVDPAAWETFAAQSGTALVGFRLMERMGWAVGSTVEVAAMGLRAEIVGLIPAQGVDLENHMLVHRSTLQVIRRAEGQISYVLVSPDERRDPVEVAAAIDEALRYSPFPTRTVSVEAYAESIIKDFMGFLDYLRLMGFVTILITTVAAANAIAMNVRERTNEIGVMKAIGYRPGQILTLILLESLILAVLGGGLGLAAAAGLIGNTGGNLAGFLLSASTVAWATALALFVGLVGGLIPALHAARVNPVQALRAIE